MADLKSIANMQIGGPKYPKKRRINLYQKQTKKGKIAAELGAFAVFMVFVYGFSRFGVMLPLQEADRAEAVYAATEKELRTLEKSNEVYGEVLAEYAHYGNGYLNEEASGPPDDAGFPEITDFPADGSFECFDHLGSDVIGRNHSQWYTLSAAGP